MNITNTELVQSYIELIGMMTCIIAVVGLSYGGLNKISRIIRNMFLVMAGILICDAGAYIFRGNLGILSISMTRICNYGNFFLNILILQMTTYLTCALLEEDDRHKKNPCLKFVGIACLSALVILVINLFTGLMFYFDGDNYYHRNTLWYVYTLLGMAILFANIFYAFYNRKKIGASMAASIMIYAATPLVLSAFQFVFYGISITNLGSMLGLIIVMYAYYFSWGEGQLKNTKLNQKRQFVLILFSAILILIISMTASILKCVNDFLEATNNNLNVLKIVLPSLGIFFLGIVMMMVMILLLIIREGSNLKESAANRQASITDELTGLLNRRAYEELLDENKLSENTIAIMLDANGLKKTNDSLGHAVGDAMICAAADCIKKAFGDFGKIYRTGGDEFVVVINCDSHELNNLLSLFDSICKNCSGVFGDHLSISKGYAKATDSPDCDLEALVRLADKNMYADKNAFYANGGL